MDVDEKSYLDQFSRDWEIGLQAAEADYLRITGQLNARAFRIIMAYEIISELKGSLTTVVLKDPVIAKKDGDTFFAWDDDHFVEFSSTILENVWEVRGGGYGVRLEIISVRVFV